MRVPRAHRQNIDTVKTLTLTAKQQRFVAEYLACLNAKEAATRAGYSPKTAEQQGYQLLQHPSVGAAVQAGKARQLETAELSAVRILEELRRLATVNIADFFDANGNIKPVQDWTREMGSCISSLEVVIQNVNAGDGKQDWVHKLKLWPKVQSLELLAKHFALLVERVEHTVEAAVLDRLDRGRLRNAERKKLPPK